MICLFGLGFPNFHRGQVLWKLQKLTQAYFKLAADDERIKRFYRAALELFIFSFVKRDRVGGARCLS